MNNISEQKTESSPRNLRLIIFFAIFMPILFFLECTLFYSRAFEAAYDHYSFSKIRERFPELKSNKYNLFMGKGEGCNFFIDDCSSLSIGEAVLHDDELFIKILNEFVSLENKKTLIINIRYHPPDEFAVHHQQNVKVVARQKYPSTILRIVKPPSDY